MPEISEDNNPPDCLDLEAQQYDTEPPETMTENMHISPTPATPTRNGSVTPSTMRRIDWSQGPRQATARRRRSGSTKQPLALDLSFGNSPSSVHQFRRVSDKLPMDVASSQLCSPMDENANPKALLRTKEAQLGKRAYGKSVGLACQEVLSTTGGQDKREAVSRLAEAFSDLEMTDPEGLYHIVRLMNEKLQR